MLHAAARVVQEMGKSRAAAFAMGIQDVDEGAHVNTFAEAADLNDSDESTHPESNVILFFNGSCLHRSVDKTFCLFYPHRSHFHHYF